MNVLHLDFVRCKNCGRTNVIRPTTFAWRPIDPRWSETETQILAVSCFQCKHVYIYEDHELQTVPTSHEELAAQNPIPVAFSTQFECDDENCDSRLIVLAARSGNTTQEDMQQEFSAWIFHDLHCSKHHPIRKPVLRLEKPYSLKCPACDAPSDDYPRDWFYVGRKLDCGFCGKARILTAEDIEKLDDLED